MTDRPTDSEAPTEERARAVLASAGHATREIQALTLTVLSATAVAGPFVRIRGALRGTVVHADWTLPNLAVRLAVPALDGGEPASRIYTVRAFDPTTETIELDVLRHGHDSPMMRWIAAVRPGDVVPLVGPRPHFVPDHAPGVPPSCSPTTPRSRPCTPSSGSGPTVRVASRTCAPRSRR